MFDGIEAFGRQLLSSIFILACTLLGARLAFGWKSELTRQAAVVGVLCLMVGLQYYFLLDVVTYVPSSRFFTYDVSHAMAGWTTNDNELSYLDIVSEDRLQEFWERYDSSKFYCRVADIIYCNHFRREAS